MQENIVWHLVSSPDPVGESPSSILAASKASGLVPSFLACLLFTITLPGFSFTLTTLAAAEAAGASTNKWDAEIQAFLEQDRLNPPGKGDILFTGSSSIRLWKGVETNFPGFKVFARGFGGSHLSDLVHQAPRIVVPYAPARILVYEGDNDIASGKTPARVLEDFKDFVRLVHSKLPDSRISYICIKPSKARWHLKEPIQETNRMIREFCQNQPRLGFIDVWKPMLDDTGGFREELFVADGLHLNASGYSIWQRVIGDHLAKGR